MWRAAETYSISRSGHGMLRLVCHSSTNAGSTWVRPFLISTTFTVPGPEGSIRWILMETEGTRYYLYPRTSLSALPQRRPAASRLTWQAILLFITTSPLGMIWLQEEPTVPQIPTGSTYSTSMQTARPTSCSSTPLVYTSMNLVLHILTIRRTS